MKRRMTLALVLAMSLSAAFAMAEETNSLKDFTSRLKGGTGQTQTAEPETPAAQSEDESSSRIPFSRRCVPLRICSRTSIPEKRT